MHAITKILVVLVVSGCTGNTQSKDSPCRGEICSGHGACVETVDGQAVCQCDPGYRAVGNTCVADCLVVDCSGQGGCVVMDGEPHCVCDHGYVGVGLECRPAPDSCRDVTCTGYGACVEHEGKPACVCRQGYAPVGLNCVPIGCSGVGCSGHGGCIVRHGAPSCICDFGFHAVGLGCRPNDCTLLDCSGHGACEQIGDDTRCICDHGYVSVASECRPLACELEDCSGHGSCVDGAHGLECLCDPGYLAIDLSCRPRCSEIDCSGHGACIQDGATVTCLCDPGYMADGHRCLPSSPTADGGPDTASDGSVPVDGDLDAVPSDSGSDGEPPGSLDWVAIAGGSFSMGSADGYSDEMPVHLVTVASFDMTGTEVTVAQYARCVAQGSCAEPTTEETCNWLATGYEDHPVNCITWEDAVDFCAWAGGRLPTEAEWEYAARSGGDNHTYPWGEDRPSCTFAVMDSGGCGCGTGRTSSVCSKTAALTGHGLCDMAGNVWELVQDWHHWSYEGAPSDGSAWEDEGWLRVKRGGSLCSCPVAGQLRTSYRGRHIPSGRDGTVGFRCAREPP